MGARFGFRLTQLPTDRPLGGRVMSVKTVPMPARPSPGGADRVLQAKITAPSVPCWMVPRPRLQDRIDEGTAGPLTVVTGPPGAGEDDGRRVVGGRQAQSRGMDHARPFTTATRRSSGIPSWRRCGTRASRGRARIRGAGPDGLMTACPAPARVGTGRAGPAGGAGPRRSSPGGGPWADGRPADPPRNAGPGCGS